MEHSSSHAEHSAPAATTYNISFQLSPPPRVGEAVQISLVVTEQRLGEPLRDFEALHDRLMHLIIVDDSMAHFAHIHPVLTDGVFQVEHVFPAAGRYKLWAEVKPAGGESVLVAHRVAVAHGTPAHTPSAASGYNVSLTPSARAPLHEMVELAFEVSDRDGNPVTDLEPLMAAGGHCVVISDDLQDFIHVHPMEEVDLSWRGGPAVRFMTSFHRPVRHGVWGQFQHRGEVITAPFSLEVEAAGHH